MVKEELQARARPESSSKAVRLDWIDVAKGIAIFLVVMGHTVPHDLLRDSIFSFHMPAFFILAGYTFRSKPWRVLIRSSIERLLVPYLLIVAVILVPQLLKSGDPIRRKAAALGEALAFPAGYPSTQWTGCHMWAGVVVDYIPGGISGVSMTWFLLCLFSARIAFNAVVRLPILRGGGMAGACVWCVAAIVLLDVGWSMSGLTGWFWLLDADLVVLACGFMAFGRALNASRMVALRFVPLGIAAGCVWAWGFRNSGFEMMPRAIENPVIAFICALAGSYALFVLSVVVGLSGRVAALRWFERCLVWLGKHSLEVYAMHAIDFFMVSWGKLLLGGTMNSVVRFLYDVLLVVFARRLTR